MDDRRGFAKSRAGEVPVEVPLSHSLCARVVDAGTPLVVESLTDHPAAADLGVRAYAGVPLALPDAPVLGSFCVADTVPRTWSEEDVALLHDLARAWTTTWPSR